MKLEKRLVEDWVMERLRETGWKYVEAEKLERVSFDEPLLMDVLKKKLLDINRDIKLVEDDLNLVVNKLKSAFTDQNGHREILRYFKYCLLYTSDAADE